MNRHDWLNIGSPLTWNFCFDPSALTRLKTKSRNGCRAAMVACSVCRSVSFQPYAGALLVSPLKASTRTPSISSAGPETLVNRPF
jgi:hypothetical protein